MARKVSGLLRNGPVVLQKTYKKYHAHSNMLFSSIYHLLFILLVGSFFFFFFPLLKSGFHIIDLDDHDRSLYLPSISTQSPQRSKGDKRDRGLLSRVLFVVIGRLYGN